MITRAPSGGAGNLVMLRHEGGIDTAYMHLSRFANIKVGDKVEAKTVIGYVGTTGLSTGPHLHYEVWLNSRPVNPMTIKFVDAWLGVMRDPTSKNARDLIISRERQAKPGRARLQLDGDYKWNGNSGAGRLTYRWGRVHRYLQDIAEAKQYP